ncbi:MAG: ABC-type dipeptide transport system, periplasmic component [Thermomicrobiales bacterium]|nr:ABC-type dipeptide transport system, periplasmic component [Thermomicrobiales bacterium]
MSRIDPLRSRLPRRDLLKLTGAAAGTAALGNLTGHGVLPARSALARQDAANAIVFGVGTDIDELDPRTTDTQEGYIVASNVYDCLVLYDLGATTIRPGLAESWEISEDGTVYTFTLRQGVSFHDGEPFNADAVVTWYNSIDEEAPDTQYDATRMIYVGDFITTWIDTVEATDEYTVTMTLPNPYAPLLANLAIPIAGIPSPAAVAQGMDYLGVNPSGTGAFRLASPDDWTRDSQMVLQANPDYWGGAPKVEQFIVRVIPESSTRLQALEAGEIDIAWALVPEDVERTRENPDLVIVEDAGLNTNMIELNVGKDPFGSKEVRQALNYAVNKEELSEGLYNGNMVAAGGVLPPVDWAFNPDLQSYPYDPDRARELLSEAGYDESNPLTFTFMAYTIPRGYNPVGDRLATAVQEYWSEVGVQADIQTAEWTQYRADRRADLYQCALGGWQGDNGDPDNFLATLLAGWSKGAGNTSFYDNPEVNDLLEQAVRVSDMEERKALYQQAEQIIVDDAPWVFLGYQKHQVVTRANITDFQLQPTYIYYFAGVGKA